WGAWAWYASVFVCLALTVGAMLGEQRNPEGFVQWVGRSGDWPLRVEAPFWLLIFVAFGVMRRKLVEFMGDVAAYVSPHVLDRFMNIRQDVKRWVIDAARDVYQRRRDEDGSYEYDGVVLMGHSLGSVVAYDSLNALLNEDEANEHRLGVAQRTRLFLTFGSPLDKTAYIFSQHERPFAATRGLMAMAVQPLICSYRRFRRIPWINVHSRRDPVCDALRLYDDPAAEECAEHCVRNVVDPE
ncbi:MAG: hypothetical protein GWN29_07700, partial [Gammaproteobacteria bacterium]|nr:hypothetical protein [Gammaproteobacteria bacterium]